MEETELGGSKMTEGRDKILKYMKPISVKMGVTHIPTLLLTYEHFTVEEVNGVLDGYRIDFPMLLAHMVESVISNVTLSNEVKAFIKLNYYFN